ncbi:MAG: hypothetical protein AAFY05_28000 [Pseudomonadota bacterium]
MEEAPANLNEASAEYVVDMKFNVPESYRREVKVMAASNGTKMVDLLKEAISLWREKNKK